MKLTIVDDKCNQEVVIPLCEGGITTRNYYKDKIFLENGIYSIRIEFDSDVNNSDVKVYVGDIAMATTVDYENALVYVSKQRLFEDCYDVAVIKIEIDFGDEIVQILETPFLYIAIKKITCVYVQSMLLDIENNYPGIVNACFSKAKMDAGIHEGGVRGLDETLEVLNNIYVSLKNIYPMFQQSIHKTIAEIHRIDNGMNVRCVDNDSVAWISRHPECLKRSNGVTPIRINQQYYTVDSVNVLNKNESKNTYENGIILGFVDLLRLYTTDLCVSLEKQINDFEENMPSEELRKIPYDYDLAASCVRFCYREILRKTKEYQESFENLYEAYSFCFECEPSHIMGVPRYTFVFRQQYHYRKCFDMISLWFNSGNYNLKSFGYFMKLKRLSKIFEYYTFIKLQEAFQEEGFRLVEPAKVLIYEEDNISEIANYYCYQNDIGQIKIELFYEPYIYSDQIKNNINLYSTGYNYLKILNLHKVKKTPYWNPDFVIKVIIDGMELYYILDSKFSALKTVKNYHIIDLANKYLLNIATKDSYISKALGVWAIYPAIEEKRFNMKKNDVQSTKESLPCIMIEPLMIGEKCLKVLVEKIVQLSKEYNQEYLEQIE